MTTEVAVPPTLGGATAERMRADLERYRDLALQSGASDAVCVPAGDVIIDERVRLKCLIPRCIRAGETPNCPPHAPDLDLIRRALSRFSWAILFNLDYGPLAGMTPNALYSFSTPGSSLRPVYGAVKNWCASNGCK